MKFPISLKKKQSKKGTKSCQRRRREKTNKIKKLSSKPNFLRKNY
jgi:hypothetical protein